MNKNIVLSALLLILNIMPSMSQEKYKASVYAQSDLQWTGIAISDENRVFVNYPTWEVYSPFKVAEIIDGKEIAYPSAKDNELFTCIQSVVVDKKNRLWVLDPASPNFNGVVSSGAKLFRIDLATNKIDKTYTFPSEVAPEKSYLNDVRIDTDLDYAYFTDSQLGGIVVLNLQTGESWRAIDSNSKVVQANLDSINFVSTGVWKGITNSDGIELSADNKTLYFSALTGDILYKVPTAILRDKSLNSDSRAKHVVIENAHNVPTDGMILAGNKLFMGNLPQESIWMYDLSTRKGMNLDLGMPIRWGDSFAHDNKGNVYFTTSQINYPVDERVKYKIIKLEKEK